MGEPPTRPSQVQPAECPLVNRADCALGRQALNLTRVRRPTGRHKGTIKALVRVDLFAIGESTRAAEVDYAIGRVCALANRIVLTLASVELECGFASPKRRGRGPSGESERASVRGSERPSVFIVVALALNAARASASLPRPAKLARSLARLSRAHGSCK